MPACQQIPANPASMALWWILGVGGMCVTQAFGIQADQLQRRGCPSALVAQALLCPAEASSASLPADACIACPVTVVLGFMG